MVRLKVFSSPGAMSSSGNTPERTGLPFAVISHRPSATSFAFVKKNQFFTFTRPSRRSTGLAWRLRYTYLMAYRPGWGLRSAETSPLLLKLSSLRTPVLFSHHPPYARKVGDFVLPLYSPGTGTRMP